MHKAQQTCRLLTALERQKTRIGLGALLRDAKPIGLSMSRALQTVSPSMSVQLLSELLG